ncbi:MAG: glycerate kinase [Bacilli bacterium]|nr:glycerate kinase [Bacilli bacterium]
MKKIVVISDSFKGSLSSEDIIQIFLDVKKEYLNNVMIKTFPIADGGEGTVKTFASFQKGQLINIKVHDSYFEMIDATYFINNHNEAIIEVASSSGLTQVKGRENPAKTSTYGVGEQILDAVKRGVKKIYIGLGGSATNDMGVGAASSLFTIFYNKNHEPFIPNGETLKDIDSYDDSRTKELLKDVEIYCLSDVNNVTYGKDGAAYIYAKQKGADEEMIKQLDSGLKSLSNVIYQKTNIDVGKLQKGGAAGGFGAGAYIFFHAKLVSGIDTILELLDFEKEIIDAEYIFTGEGKVDQQTLKGKAIYGVAKIAKKHHIPLIVICGKLDDDIKKEDLDQLGIIKAIPISSNYDLNYALSHAKELYKQNLIKLLKDL